MPLLRCGVPVYGLDIETDTTVDGFDPAVAAIVTVALSGPDGDEVFDGSPGPARDGPCGTHRGADEARMLAALDARLASLPAGVLATWNGSFFDLPFLADRAAHHDVDLGLRLTLDPRIVSRRDPLPGHQGAYRACWHGHRHLDAFQLYRGDVGRLLGVSCSLKAIARLVGLEAVEVDRARIHDLSPDVLAAYVASDARLARLLAERRGDCH
jgi:DNA polymerase elongation subunit (family B)